MTRSETVSNASPAASLTGFPMTWLRYGMARASRYHSAHAQALLHARPRREPRFIPSRIPPGAAGPPGSTSLLPVRIVACSMPALSSFAVAALRAAHAAGEIHRAAFGKGIKIDYKGRNDPVTEADRAAEAAAVDVLRSAFPDHAFLGEEGGRRGTGAHTWLIDPLDGTFNFAHA